MSRKMSLMRPRLSCDRADKGGESASTGARWKWFGGRMEVEDEEMTLVYKWA
jgi:hypothetical protein